MNATPVYPMSALVDLDDLVLTLVLAAVDPAIGGVLLRGDKGSAKTTAARALRGCVLFMLMVLLLRYRWCRAAVGRPDRVCVYCP